MTLDHPYIGDFSMIEFTEQDLHQMSMALSEVSLLPPGDLEILNALIKAVNDGVFTLEQLVSLLDVVVVQSKEGASIDRMIDVLEVAYEQ